MNYAFDESEMPYSTLERFGLTQQMVEDLPSHILENIWNGHRSPVLPIAVSMEDGEVVEARTSFKLIRKPDDTVDILFYPKLDEYDLQLFNEEQKAKLMEGKAIIGSIGKENTADNGTKQFFQIDPDSKQVLSVPTPVIDRNIQYLADRYNLSGTDIEKLQDGEVLSTQDNGETISFGIDLNSKTGIRFAAGDEDTWKKEAKHEWEKYPFGIFGCWVTDENGDLNYIEEKDYTEEMWEAQRSGTHGVQR